MAVDISIWQFQIQSGRGGSNPALRTLYYRLLRLLTLGIEALFVFDGPNKPPFKRNKRTSPQNGASLPNFLAKKLAQALGFPCHSAPGEAEAECAALQRAGIVDAVLSEDTDTLMFGSTQIMKNWSATGTRGNKQPSHVDLYDAEEIGKSKLDREGMVLVAMMSGGDYTPDGIDGCGIKVACEIARAGFGKELLSLSKRDQQGLRVWKERLQHELATNESHLFRTKHKNLTIPEDFPDFKLLSFYTKPVISSAEAIEALRSSIQWVPEIDVTALRTFVSEAFEWEYITGARKLIRGLAPAMLTKCLLHRRYNVAENPARDDDFEDEISLQRQKEESLIKAIHSQRTHFITDGQKEICVSYVPNDIVRLDLSNETEPDVQGYDKERSDDEGSLSVSDREVPIPHNPRKPRAKPSFDPLVPQKLWVLESFLKVGVPLALETWEEEMRNPIKFATRKAKARKQLTGVDPGAMDKYVKIFKPGISRQVAVSQKPDTVDFDIGLSTPRARRSEILGRSQSESTNTSEGLQVSPTKNKPTKVTRGSATVINPKTNPWTLAKSQLERPNADLPQFTLSVLPANHSTTRDRNANANTSGRIRRNKKFSPAICISSSPVPEEREASFDREEANTIPKRKDGNPLAEDMRQSPPAHGASINSRPRSPSLSPLPSPFQIFGGRSKSIPINTELPKTVSFSASLEASSIPAISNPKRGVALRESLEGAWKISDDPDDGAGNGKAKKRVFSRVSIVDLTNDGSLM